MVSIASALLGVVLLFLAVAVKVFYIDQERTHTYTLTSEGVVKSGKSSGYM